jgi:hypothetical protein
VPPWASSKRPSRRLGAREGPALVAEELGLEQRLRQRRAVDADERAGVARALVVDEVRDALLPGAALAGDEHGALGGRHALGGLQELLRLPREGDDLLPVGGRDLVAEVLVLAFQPGSALDAPHDELERVGGAGLHQEVDRTEAHRLDRSLDRPVGRDHDDGHVAALLADGAHEVEAGEAGHAQVGQHQVDALLAHALQGFLAARRALGLETEGSAGFGEELAGEGIVVDDEHALDGHDQPISPGTKG